MLALFVFLIFLCWGSFLNMVGYRLIHAVPFHGRSRCTTCQQQLPWYDLVPIISWVLLAGRCRSCQQPISILYPFIELYSAILLTTLWFISEPHFFIAYFLLFSALIVVTRTDLETMLISRLTSIFLVPLGLLFAAYGQLPISVWGSLYGALFGYGILWLVRALFFAITHKEGLGLGDVEVLALVGSFTGVIGVWATLTIGSMLGTIAGGIYLLFTKNPKIPFGPFLALGAMAYVLLQPFITAFLIP